MQGTAMYLLLIWDEENELYEFIIYHLLSVGYEQFNRTLHLVQ